MTLEQSIHKMNNSAIQLAQKLQGYAMTTNNKQELDQSVIELHNIARRIEQNVGQGQLSEDVRKCADRLHELIKIQ